MSYMNSWWLPSPMDICIRTSRLECLEKKTVVILRGLTQLAIAAIYCTCKPSAVYTVYLFSSGVFLLTLDLALVLWFGGKDLNRYLINASTIYTRSAGQPHEWLQLYMQPCGCFPSLQELPHHQLRCVLNIQFQILTVATYAWCMQILSCPRSCSYTLFCFSIQLYNFISIVNCLI